MKAKHALSYTAGKTELRCAHGCSLSHLPLQLNVSLTLRLPETIGEMLDLCSELKKICQEVYQSVSKDIQQSLRMAYVAVVLWLAHRDHLLVHLSLANQDVVTDCLTGLSNYCKRVASATLTRRLQILVSCTCPLLPLHTLIGLVLQQEGGKEHSGLVKLVTKIVSSLKTCFSEIISHCDFQTEEAKAALGNAKRQQQKAGPEGRSRRQQHWTRAPQGCTGETGRCSSSGFVSVQQRECRHMADQSAAQLITLALQFCGVQERLFKAVPKNKRGNRWRSWFRRQVLIWRHWSERDLSEVEARMQELSTELEGTEERKEKTRILVSLSGCGLLST